MTHLLFDDLPFFSSEILFGTFLCINIRASLHGSQWLLENLLLFKSIIIYTFSVKGHHCGQFYANRSVLKWTSLYLFFFFCLLVLGINS